MLYVLGRSMKKKSTWRLLIFVPVLFCIGVLLSLGLSSLDNKIKAFHSDILKERGPKTQTASQRIICATPGVAEIVFSLGLGDRVVGVSQFSTYPPEVKTKAVIGGLIDPNKERILSLQPDLFLTQGKHPVMSAFCREHGIEFLSVEIEKLAHIPRAVLILGRELNARKAAEHLAESISAGIRSIEERIRERPKRRVFLSLGHTPGDLTSIMTTGNNTFLNELLVLSGGENIFADAHGKYPQISKEVLVIRQPDIIIEIGGLPSDKVNLLKNDWEKLNILDAVKSGNIHFLTEDYLLIPGVRVAKTAERLARLIHPEVFDE